MSGSTAVGSFTTSLTPLGGPMGVQSTDGVRLLYLVAGLALLVGVVADLLWTTLWVDGGAGPLSARLSTWPSPPDLGELRAAVIPALPHSEFERNLENLDERRRKLLSVVEADAWNWPPENHG